MPCAIPLTPAPSTVILVLDHSNAAFDVVDDSRPPPVITFWDELRDGVESSVSVLDANLAVGVVVFPECDGSGTTCTEFPAYCQAPQRFGVEVAPNSAGRVRAYLDALPEPQYSGASPIAGSLDVALRWVATHTDTHATVVLATLGYASCALGVPRDACQCETPPAGSCYTPDAGANASYGCDDTVHALTEEATLRGRGVETVVIGANMVDRTEYTVQRLNDMAVAGGRPLSDPLRRFHDIERVGDGRAVFQLVLGEIALCRQLVPRVSFDRDRVALRARGVATWARDASHVNGWDYTDESGSEVQLFGEACRTAANAHAALELVTLDDACW